MASIVQPIIVSYLSDGVLAQGVAVIPGSDAKHVIASTGSTAPIIGISQNATTAAGQVVEVAFPGGGAKALSQAAFTVGKYLTSHTDGSLKVVAAQHDKIVAVALETASAGGVLVSVFGATGQATQAET